MRAALQMTTADSASLMESPLANKLGHHRAKFYHEERGQPRGDCLRGLKVAWGQAQKTEPPELPPGGPLRVRPLPGPRLLLKSPS
jgi:hypothetical protein